jgi:MFS family permease
MRRTRSATLMLLLIYLFPALMDLIVSVISFVNPIRVAKMGYSASAVAGVGAIWSLVYMFACPVVGARLTPANSSRTVLLACVAMGVVCALFPFFPGLSGIYMLAALAGLIAALFFPAFQVFMKAADGANSKPIAYSTGLYTFAWSFGFALAPFVSGFLMELGTAVGTGAETSGWKYCYLFAGLCALVAAVGFYLVERYNRSRGLPAGADAAGPRGSANGKTGAQEPDLAWLGWISAGAGVIALAVIRGIFPARAVVTLHMSDSAQGLIAFLLYLTQALTGLALIPQRRWMFSPWAVGVSGTLGVVGACCFGLLTAPFGLGLGAVLFGTYSGFFFFYFVFHALSHPVRSAQYVGINEAVVGVGGLIGPVAGGLLADHAGFESPFIAGAVIVGLATLFQMAVHHRHPSVTP